jgi:hypothetical protein
MTEGVTQYSFGTFVWIFCAAIILVLFCIAYLYVRRRRKARHVDQKAGDEGQD